MPLVQIHATSCYVDLPGNAAAAAVVLLAIQCWVEASAINRKTVVLACVLGAFAANMKTMMQPIVFVSLVAMGVRLVLQGQRRTAFMMGLALPVVFATSVKNLIVHHNPAYPISFAVLGHRFPGPDEPYFSSPTWLEHAPQPVRFLCSVFELGVRPLHWTVDQWTPPEAPGYRMGGFFGFYVAALLALLVWRGVRERHDGGVRAALVGFGIFTTVVSVLPQSHELRYYMGWMMVLVALNLWLARRSQSPTLGAHRVALGCAAALGAVLFITHGEYAYASGETFRELVHAEVDESVLGHVHDGAHVCVRRAPWNFLWAAPFHAPKSYVVQEADAPADCAGAPSL